MLTMAKPTASDCGPILTENGQALTHRRFTYRADQPLGEQDLVIDEALDFGYGPGA